MVDDPQGYLVAWLLAWMSPTNMPAATGPSPILESRALIKSSQIAFQKLLPFFLPSYLHIFVQDKGFKWVWLKIGSPKKTWQITLLFNGIHCTSFSDRPMIDVSRFSWYLTLKPIMTHSCYKYLIYCRSFCYQPGYPHTQLVICHI